MQGLESFAAILQFATAMNLVLAPILPKPEMEKISEVAGYVNLEAPEKSLDGKAGLKFTSTWIE